MIILKYVLAFWLAFILANDGRRENLTTPFPYTHNVIIRFLTLTLAEIEGPPFRSELP